MHSANCAFYGCFRSSRKKNNILLFETPVISTKDGDHMQNAREEWLRLILRKREMTPELKKKTNRNQQYPSVSESSSLIFTSLYC